MKYLNNFLLVYSYFIIKSKKIFIYLLALQIIIHKTFNCSGYSLVWNFIAGNSINKLFLYSVILGDILYRKEKPITQFAHFFSFITGKFYYFLINN